MYLILTKSAFNLQWSFVSLEDTQVAFSLMILVVNSCEKIISVAGSRDGLFNF